MVRYRIDGILIEAESLPKTPVRGYLKNKIMSKMNIAERRCPGWRIKLRIPGNRPEGFNPPTPYGESGNENTGQGNVLTSLEELGFPETALSQFENL